MRTDETSQLYPTPLQLLILERGNNAASPFSGMTEMVGAYSPYISGVIAENRLADILSLHFLRPSYESCVPIAKIMVDLVTESCPYMCWLHKHWIVCTLIMLPSINAYVLFNKLRMFFTGKTDTGMPTGFIPAVDLDKCDVNSKPVLVD